MIPEHGIANEFLFRRDKRKQGRALKITDVHLKKVPLWLVWLKSDHEKADYLQRLPYRDEKTLFPGNV